MSCGFYVFATKQKAPLKAHIFRRLILPHKILGPILSGAGVSDDHTVALVDTGDDKLSEQSLDGP
jgi:hypothetical protein